MNWTSIEQSKKLLELGLSPESADMEYMFLKKDGSKVSNVPFVKEPYEEPDSCYNFIPCWSVGALLELMPEVIYTSNGNCFFLCWHKKDIEYVGYHMIKADTFIEAAYNMVVWLLENNYIKQ